MCEPCHEECRDACSGPGPTQCDACKNLRLQIEVENSGGSGTTVVAKCVSECPPTRAPNKFNVCVCEEHTYPDHGTLACLECHPECASGCSGPDVTDCIGACAHAQHAAECVVECPSEFYESTDTAAFHTLYPHVDIISERVCLPCNEQCAFSCTGPGPGDCIARSADSPLCVSFEEDGVCRDECSSNAYAHEETHTCLPCNEECNGCLGPGADECLQCAHVRSTDGVCLPDCPANTYATQRGVCEQCHPMCADVCFGPSDRQCFTSPQEVGSSAPVCRYVHVDSRCVGECPAGFFEDRYMACVACHSECGDEGCHGPEAQDCSNCRHVMLQSGACARECKENEFEDEARVCRSCHSTCTHGCRGPAAGDCLSEEEACAAPHPTCASGEFFDTAACACVEDSCPSGMLYKDHCVPSCPAGTFVAGDGRRCSACAANCDACTGPEAAQCTACVHAGVWQDSGSLLCFAEDKCPQPQTQFVDPVSRVCTACDEECSGCVGTSNHDCVACKHVELQGACVAECPGNFFEKQTASGVVCQPCDAECKSGCSGPTAAHCTACLHARLDGTCVSTCPASTFFDDGTGECVQCSEACLLGCSGPTTADCIESRCVNLNLDGKCVSHCPTGYYASADSHCLPCHSSCAGHCVDGTPSGCVHDATAVVPTESSSSSITQHPPTAAHTPAPATHGTSHPTQVTTARTANGGSGGDTDSSGGEKVVVVGTSNAEVIAASVLLAVVLLVVFIVWLRSKVRGE